MDALAVLADPAIADKGSMVSFDYSLAFAMLDPNVVHELLLQAGLPQGALLSGVWENQMQYLQYDGQCYPNAMFVTQGDSRSLVAMVLCLTGPGSISKSFPTMSSQIFCRRQDVRGRLLLLRPWKGKTHGV